MSGNFQVIRFHIWRCFWQEATIGLKTLVIHANQTGFFDVFDFNFFEVKS